MPFGVSYQLRTMIKKNGIRSVALTVDSQNEVVSFGWRDMQKRLFTAYGMDQRIIPS